MLEECACCLRSVGDGDCDVADGLWQAGLECAFQPATVTELSSKGLSASRGTYAVAETSESLAHVGWHILKMWNLPLAVMMLWKYAVDTEGIG